MPMLEIQLDPENFYLERQRAELRHYSTRKLNNRRGSSRKLEEPSQQMQRETFHAAMRPNFYENDEDKLDFNL